MCLDEFAVKGKLDSPQSHNGADAEPISSSISQNSNIQAFSLKLAIILFTELEFIDRKCILSELGRDTFGKNAKYNFFNAILTPQTNIHPPSPPPQTSSIPNHYGAPVLGVCFMTHLYLK